MEFDKFELEIFEELFNAIDKESEGSITYKEIHALFKSIGGNATEIEIQDMVNEMDTDGNGMIELDEFADMLVNKLNSVSSQDDLRDAFQIFDKDNNGYIGFAEIRTIYLSMGVKLSDEDIDEMIREADYDQDGVVNFDDFYTMMTSG